MNLSNGQTEPEQFSVLNLDAVQTHRDNDVNISEVSTVDSLEDLINNFDPETTTAATVPTSKSTPPPSKREFEVRLTYFSLDTLNFRLFDD